MKAKLLKESYGIQKLFFEVFKTNISKAMLDWKYGCGRGYNIGYVDENGDIVGHVGAIYRTIGDRGNLIVAPQMVDLMVSSKKSTGLSIKKSVFYQICHLYLSMLTTEQNLQGLTYGFPSARAMGAGKKMGIFASVDSVYELKFGKVKRSWWGATVKPLTNASEIELVLDELWPKMRDDFYDELIGFRDFEYINYRYLNHPEYNYLCFVIKGGWSKKTVGFAVLRELDETVELMDLVCRKKDMAECILSLQTNLLDKKPMQMWLTQRYAKEFEKYAISSLKTEFEILANPIGADAIRGRWWITSGDAEYR